MSHSRRRRTWLALLSLNLILAVAAYAGPSPVVAHEPEEGCCRESTDGDFCCFSCWCWWWQQDCTGNGDCEETQT
jgi:hypothetical protein